MTENPNAQQIQHWNSPVTRAWSDHPEPIDRLFVKLTTTLLDFAAVMPGERILDIGCATGTTILELAARTGQTGEVLGADIAEKSIVRARERIAAAKLQNATAELADVSTCRFKPNHFDLVFSRFGVMFFSDPVATFARLRSAIKPTGRLAIAVWRSPSENAWATAPRAAIAHLLPPIVPQAPEDPGQFSWANPDRVSRILTDAGYRNIALTPHDPPMQLAAAGEPDQAIDFVMRMGPIAAASQAAPPDRQAAIHAGLKTFFQTHETSVGITFPGAIWLVSADM